MVRLSPGLIAHKVKLDDLAWFVMVIMAGALVRHASGPFFAQPAA